MKLRFNLTFKNGPRTVASVTGGPEFDGGMTMDEAAALVLELEAKLERLTGYRVHIFAEQVDK